MAENIAKIDEKIRELKRKKKTAENQQMIKACNAYLRSLNSSLKESGIQVKRIDEVLGFLLEQEANGKWVSKWLAKSGQRNKERGIRWEHPAQEVTRAKSSARCQTGQPTTKPLIQA